MRESCARWGSKQLRKRGEAEVPSMEGKDEGAGLQPARLPTWACAQPG